MKDKIAKLINVKSIVTIILTIVFAMQTFRGMIDGNQFLSLFTTIIAFYFGTQTAKNE